LPPRLLQSPSRPIVFGFFYTSGDFNNVKCGANLDQTVTAVGYGTDPVGGDYWLIRNLWGEAGYIKITRI
jgi:hypothetical protein